MTVFGIIYKLLDEYCWRWKWIRRLGIIKTPDLNGRWKGKLYSSYHEFKEDDSLPAILTIKQTWSKIYIRGQFSNSKSLSYTTSIKVLDDGKTKVFYSYRNDKKPEYYDKDFSDHKGYGELEFNDKVEKIEGIYFNNPTNNPNHGKLFLEKYLKR